MRSRALRPRFPKRSSQRLRANRLLHRRLGSGTLVDLEEYACLTNLRRAKRSRRAPTSLRSAAISFWRPAAGLIVGRSDLIQRIKKIDETRAESDKMTWLLWIRIAAYATRSG